MSDSAAIYDYISHFISISKPRAIISVFSPLPSVTFQR